MGWLQAFPDEKTAQSGRSTGQRLWLKLELAHVVHEHQARSKPAVRAMLVTVNIAILTGVRSIDSGYWHHWHSSQATSAKRAATT